MTHVSVAAAMRQFSFDFLVPDLPEAPTSTIPPRLLILACSGSKAPGKGLSARERYIGPLWQTLKAADPEGRRTYVAYLSARYGLGDARAPLPDYNSVLTRQSADVMIERGLGGFYPHYPMEFRTEAARARHVANREPLRTPALSLSKMTRELGRPFEDIAICGGKHYVRVAQALVAEMRAADFTTPQAPIALINDQIGYMRAQLRAWLDRDDR